MGGLQILEMLQSEHGYDIEFRQSGALKAIQTEEELDFLQKEVHTSQITGIQRGVVVDTRCSIH